MHAKINVLSQNRAQSHYRDYHVFDDCDESVVLYSFLNSTHDYKIGESGTDNKYSYLIYSN